jgi:hypothetical protein
MVTIRQAARALSMDNARGNKRRPGGSALLLPYADQRH